MSTSEPVPTRVPPDDAAQGRHVVSARHGDATVLLNIRAGDYFILHGVGGLVWEMIGDGMTVPEIVAKIASESGTPVNEVGEDVGDFVRDLSDAGLLEAR